jgi:AraC-like DNA-binding protein
VGLLKLDDVKFCKIARFSSMAQKIPRLTSLPPLPFGERLATLNADPKAFGDRMASAVPSLQAYGPLGDNKKFRSKSVAVQVNGLQLVAAANTPVSVQVGAATRCNVLIPFFGTNLTAVGQRNLNWDAGQNALYLPAIGRGGHCSTRSTLTINFEPDRLQQSARAMLGLGADQSVDLYLEDARLLPLHSPGRDADKSWRHICGLIDTLCEEPLLLGQLGVDELVYRNMVLMFRPDLFEKTAPTLAQDKAIRVVSQRALDPLCSFIQTKLEARITLTDMEQVSGMSSRALQYAFLQRYQCTPMQWVRDARLDSARAILIQNEQDLTIGLVAERLGFAKQSTFSALFKTRFGETPSTLMARQRRR